MDKHKHQLVINGFRSEAEMLEFIDILKNAEALGNHLSVSHASKPPIKENYYSFHTMPAIKVMRSEPYYEVEHPKEDSRLYDKYIAMLEHEREAKKSPRYAYLEIRRPGTEHPEIIVKKESDHE